MQNDIFCVGYPKVGTTHLCRLLGDVLNSPVGASYRPVSGKAIATEGENRPGKYYVGQGHLVVGSGSDVLIPNNKTINPQHLTTEKIVFMYRDPRDVIVSANHHWGIDDIHRTIMLCATGKWPITHGGGLEKYYRMWLYSPLPNAKTKYETLLQDPITELSRILEWLEIEHNEQDVIDACERQAFGNRLKLAQEQGDSMNYGKDFQVRFMRKGIVGDWQNVFDDRAIELCEQHFGELIRELGYENP